MKNDYQLEWRRKTPAGWEDGEGVFNGDVGFITAVDVEEHCLTVCFDEEKEAVYASAQLENLELAYCLSVHKSQGSEFPVVVMPVVGGPPMLLTRNLFYTALTPCPAAGGLLVGREEGGCAPWWKTTTSCAAIPPWPSGLPPWRGCCRGRKPRGRERRGFMDGPRRTGGLSRLGDSLKELLWPPGTFLHPVRCGYPLPEPLPAMPGKPEGLRPAPGAPASRNDGGGRAVRRLCL